MQTNRFSTSLFLAPLLAFAAIGAGLWWASPHHPASIVGTWNVGPGVTVTFAEDGKVTLNGEGSAPAFLADLDNLGHWEVARGKIFLQPKQTDSRGPSHEYDYSFEDGGSVLRISSYRFSRR